MHWRHFRLTLTIVYGPILTTSPCATLTIYSSTRPMRRSTKTTSEKCCNAYRNLDSIAKPKSANSESGKSASSDLSSIRMESASSQTAYPRSKTGRLQNQFGMCKCSLASQLLPEIHSEICKGDGSHIKLAKDTRVTEVGMDSGCRTRIPEAQKGLYRSTNPPAFQPAKTDHSAVRCQQLRNPRHPQPVRRIRDCAPSQFLLSKMLAC
jgi:hypothetical protein